MFTHTDNSIYHKVLNDLKIVVSAYIFEGKFETCDGLMLGTITLSSLQGKLDFANSQLQIFKRGFCPGIAAVIPVIVELPDVLKDKKKKLFVVMEAIFSRFNGSVNLLKFESGKSKMGLSNDTFQTITIGPGQRTGRVDIDSSARQVQAVEVNYLNVVLYIKTMFYQHCMVGMCCMITGV